MSLFEQVMRATFPDQIDHDRVVAIREHVRRIRRVQRNRERVLASILVDAGFMEFEEADPCPS